MYSFSLTIKPSGIRRKTIKKGIIIIKNQPIGRNNISKIKKKKNNNEEYIFYYRKK